VDGEISPQFEVVSGRRTLGGIAAVASSTAHGLLVFRPHSFDQVAAYELRTAAVLLSGLWLGFLFSLLLSAEFWEPRRPSAWRTPILTAAAKSVMLR
jgi:hypothetical protein